MTEEENPTQIDRTRGLLAAHRDDFPTCKATEFYADEEGYREAGRELHAAHLSAQASRSGSLAALRQATTPPS